LGAVGCSYTLDEGTTPLKSFEFSTTPVDVWNIIIEPSTVGRAFILLGLQNDNGVVMGLDFSAIQEVKFSTTKQQLLLFPPFFFFLLILFSHSHSENVKLQITNSGNQ
jgi:hypothetical protein